MSLHIPAWCRGIQSHLQYIVVFTSKHLIRSRYMLYFKWQKCLIVLFLPPCIISSPYNNNYCKPSFVTPGHQDHYSCLCATYYFLVILILPKHPPEKLLVNKESIGFVIYRDTGKGEILLEYLSRPSNLWSFISPTVFRNHVGNNFGWHSLEIKYKQPAVKRSVSKHQFHLANVN